MTNHVIVWKRIDEFFWLFVSFFLSFHCKNTNMGFTIAWEMDDCSVTSQSFEGSASRRNWNKLLIRNLKKKKEERSMFLSSIGILLQILVCTPSYQRKRITKWLQLNNFTERLRSTLPNIKRLLLGHLHINGKWRRHATFDWSHSHAMAVNKHVCLHNEQIRISSYSAA